MAMGRAAAIFLPTTLSRSSRPRSSSLRKASERLFDFIAGNFESKSLEWGETRLDRRGILLGELVARNDLIVLNRGRDFTFSWRTLCGLRGGKWSQHVTTRCLVAGTGVPGTRCTGGTTSCLSCVDFVDWKKQRLVLLRNGNKPLEDASSYRPICLLDTMGKLLAKMVLQRLQGHMVGENGLSENQLGFWKGRSTVDTIQAVVDIATKARRGTGKRNGFCALISIDIRNAFNTAKWNICIEAMVQKRVLDYLLRMIDDYLNNRWVIYKGDKCSLKEEMTCGAP